MGRNLHTNDVTEAGRRVLSVLEDRGMSLADLSRACGRKGSWAYRLIRKGAVSLRDAHMVADVLGVDALSLFADERGE